MKYCLLKRLLALSCICLLGSSCSKDKLPTESIPEGDYVDRSLEFDKLSGWKFRVSLYAEKAAVEKAGGQMALLKKMDAQMKKASDFFSSSGLDNKLTFYITSFIQFSGASKPYMTDARVEQANTCDIRLVLNPGASSSDVSSGWMPAPYLSAGLDVADPFSEQGLIELVKVLAQSRGVYDYSLTRVDNSQNNSISGDCYIPEEGLMSLGKLEAGLSEYGKAVINASGASRIARRHYEFIPSNIKAQVFTCDGSIASDAKLKFYKVLPGSGKVEKKPAFSGGLTITGNFIFASNPFFNSENREDNVANYLVEVTGDSYRHFTWMPIHVIEYETIRDKNYNTFKINLPDFSTYIPDGDYINRIGEFNKLQGWKFRVRIYGEQNTVNNVGGQLSFMKKVDELLHECSDRFNYPGIDGQVHFFATEFRYFEGLSKTLRYDPSLNEDSFDLSIFIRDSHSEGDVSGGYLAQPYYNIGHDWSGSGGLWAGSGVDALVHEMGHSRGIPDLYAEEVEASKNPINGKAYESVNDMMNYPYGNRVWSEYSRMIINANGGNRHVVKEHHEFLPQSTKLTVIGPDGATAFGAKVEIYPVKAYSYGVEREPSYSFELDGDYYHFDRSPFLVIGSSSTADVYTNNLVKVSYSGRTSYFWWPLHEAELYGGTQGQDYKFVVRL